jgi:hypothetical protein
MKNEFIAIVRREQTKQQLELVSKTIIDELDAFVALDDLGLHKTQFESVKNVLQIAIKELATHLDDIKVKQLDLEDVYDACRDFDEAIIWLQRLWSYLKDKFGQRQGMGAVSQLLKAADEVVWSCFHSVLSRSLNQHGPAPLSYIEPEYSPATIQTDKPLPPSLRLEADLEFLDQCLETLPIPVLRLPPTCISSPWWLIFVGHEVGHHVQYALDLIAHFRKGLTAAALKSKNFSENEAASTWGNWGEEIFADVFSIMIMGPSALRAMVELETGPAEKMVKRKPNYPSPVVRLALIKALADKLELKTEPELLGLDLAVIANADPVSAIDYAVVPEAIDFVLQPLPDGSLLKDLCDFRNGVFEDDDKVSGWSVMLTSDNDIVVDKKEMQELNTARNIICGSVKAWAEHATGTDASDSEAAYLQRNKIRDRLKNNTIKALLLSGPRDTRAREDIEQPDPQGQGKTLAKLLANRSKRKAGEQGAV